MVEPLLIDIETIIKMLRFLPSFREYFVKNKYLDKKYINDFHKYVDNGNILSKDILWEFCCVVEHIIEINILIKEWRNNTTDYSKIELQIQRTKEKEYSHDIVGSIIKTDTTSKTYKKLIKEIQYNTFFYNKMSIMPSSVIDKDEICLLHFFY